MTDKPIFVPVALPLDEAQALFNVGPVGLHVSHGARPSRRAWRRAGAWYVSTRGSDRRTSRDRRMITLVGEIIGTVAVVIALGYYAFAIWATRHDLPHND